jgi:hypothetical protein
MCSNDGIKSTRQCGPELYAIKLLSNVTIKDETSRFQLFFLSAAPTKSNDGAKALYAREEVDYEYWRKQMESFLVCLFVCLLLIGRILRIGIWVCA